MKTNFSFFKYEPSSSTILCGSSEVATLPGCAGLSEPSLVVLHL